VGGRQILTRRSEPSLSDDIRAVADPSPSPRLPETRARYLDPDPLGRDKAVIRTRNPGRTSAGGRGLVVAAHPALPDDKRPGTGTVSVTAIPAIARYPATPSARPLTGVESFDRQLPRPTMAHGDPIVRRGIIHARERPTHTRSAEAAQCPGHLTCRSSYLSRERKTLMKTDGRPPLSSPSPPAAYPEFLATLHSRGTSDREALAFSSAQRRAGVRPKG